MVINKSGVAIRMPISDIRTMGRATQGVKLIELQKRQDSIAFSCIVPKDEEQPEMPQEQGDSADSETIEQPAEAENNQQSAEAENNE